MRKKYLRFTDLHLNLVWPLSVHLLVRHINKEDPEAVFLTGDISSGPLLEFHLKQLARGVKCPIYFVLGNHDYHKRSIEGTHADVRRICATHSNMHWMTDEDVISLNDEVALVGTEGWYDAEVGDPGWIRYTSDWFLMPDLLFLDNMDQRIERFRDMAKKSAQLIGARIEKALETHKDVFVLTHVPPWTECTRDRGTFFENFWLPYNTNTIMGQTIEAVMQDRKKKHCTVLAGHTHTETWVRVRRNIECHVSKANYMGVFRTTDHIYI